MKKEIIYLLIIILISGGLIFSCEKDNYNNPDSAKLTFSTDTVMFDTIFTTLGSTTQSFRVKNPYNQTLLISSIKLAGGDQSSYRLNIDGEMVNEIKDIELRPKDSLYIFVEVTIDPNGVNQPMIVHDSIVFTIDGGIQDVDLVAYGQDFVPIRQGIINTTTWTADKPYLVFDYAFIDSLQTLTIEAGTHIFLHDSAGIFVAGTIIAKGTPENPIIFQGDRLEQLYKDVPDQWGGIMIYPNTTQSVFENVEIKNGMVGLQLGHVYYDGGANVKLHNVKIEHMTFYGIYGVKSNIEATNTLVDDCGSSCIYLIVGGSYDFNHCTVANYWGSLTHRTTPSVIFTNYASDDSTYYAGDLVKLNWNNSVIWGNLDGSELGSSSNGQNAFNYSFDHCLIKVSDSIYKADIDHYTEILRNTTEITYIDSILFEDVDNYNYIPDSLSPLRDFGLRSYAEEVPLDLTNISRLDDSGPDIGAYEYIYKKEE